jgi:hypothetical protein
MRRIVALVLSLMLVLSAAPVAWAENDGVITLQFWHTGSSGGC